MRKGIRRVWGSWQCVKVSGGCGGLGNAHCESLPAIGDCLTMMNELCNRCIKVTNGCMVSECATVRRLAGLVLPVGRMNSISGSECSLSFNTVRVGYF